MLIATLAELAASGCPVKLSLSREEFRRRWGRAHEIYIHRCDLFADTDVQWMLGCAADIVRPAAFYTEPLTVVADYRPHLTPGYHISVNSAGSADVTTDLHRASPTRESTNVTDATTQELRAALQSEKFFMLPSTLGSPAVDGTVVTLTVVLGPYSHTVVAQHGNLASHVEEAERFFRVYRSAVSPVRDQLKNPRVVRMLELDGAVGSSPPVQPFGPRQDEP